MRIGLFVYGPGLPTAVGIDAILARFVQAEKDGYASAWGAVMFDHDTVMLMALAGRLTERLELGTAVAPTYPRHPFVLAQQALTVQAACHNRFALGIGLSHKVVIENMLGLDYSKPIRHMREYLTVLNTLLNSETARFQGEEYRVRARIGIPDVQKPPLLVAALGPQMLKLCGRLADGTITWMGGPKYLSNVAIPTISNAAQEAGRPAPRIVAGFPVAVTSQPEVAHAQAAETFAVYGQLPSYRAVLDIEGAADPTGVAIIGDEATVERQIRSLADVGVTDFCAAPFEIKGDPDAWQRTNAFVASLARAGV